MHIQIIVPRFLYSGLITNEHNKLFYLKRFGFIMFVRTNLHSPRRGLIFKA